MLGVGIGNSGEKWGYLPEAHNDFIFAIIGEETGFVGAAMVILLFIVMTWCMLMVAVQVRDRYITMALVCIAVWMSFAAKRVSGKLLTSYWPVMLFVLCGFEHSIADMYFGVCGLLTAQVYGIAAESLTWFNFLVKALLPITLGNIVGGAGIVGCGYWLAYLHRTPYSADTTAAEQEEIDIAEEY